MAGVKDAVDGREFYTPPRVVKISDLNRGQGTPPSCGTGSGDTGNCMTGNFAGTVCRLGNNGDAV